MQTSGISKQTTAFASSGLVNIRELFHDINNMWTQEYEKQISVYGVPVDLLREKENIVDTKMLEKIENSDENIKEVKLYLETFIIFHSLFWYRRFRK